MFKIIGTVQKEKEIFLYYVTSGENTNLLKAVTSQDGFEFDENTKSIIVKDEKYQEEKEFRWKNIKISKQKNLTYLIYQKDPSGTVDIAYSGDSYNWTKLASISDIKEPAAIVPDYKYKKQYVMYFGEKDIKIAYSPDLMRWKINEESILQPREKYFDSDHLEVESVYYRDKDIILLYYAKKKIDNSLQHFVGAAIFDKKNPERPIWRSETPLWKYPQYTHGEIHPLNSAIIHDQLILYWLINDTNIFVISCQIPGRYTDLKRKSFSALLNKFKNNPIIAPIPDHPWESRATFNSAAVYEDGKVHFIYRALGDKDLSVLGYATSTDGINIDERSKEPAYIPREPFETPGQQIFKNFADQFLSGGGYGGVEDPRITKIDDKFYMTYVAFDGSTPPRVALTSISVDNFLNRRWDKWERPQLISAPGIVNKNAVIFPEKINGKYVIFHRIYPNILIDFVDDLKFDNYLQGHYFITPRKTHWDSKKIGAGAPPIKTKDGWLFIYQSVGYHDPGRYKIGAMLLDHNDPTKVLYRTNAPIIEPVEKYENEGFKSGVVYPCGAVIMNNRLNVYYGGADTFVCAASADVDTFLNKMKIDQEPKLRRVRAPMTN